jgi:hypothetical protein
MPQKYLALPGLAGTRGLDVFRKGVRHLGPQRDFNPHASLETNDRDAVPVPINIVEPQRQHVGRAPSITGRSDEHGEISLAKRPCSIDGRKDLFEHRPGNPLGRPLRHLTERWADDGGGEISTNSLRPVQKPQKMAHAHAGIRRTRHGQLALGG